MKIHRVRIVQSTDNKIIPHYIIEVEDGRWLEFSGVPLHRLIDEFLEQEKVKGVKEKGYSNSDFYNGKIENWAELKHITDDNNLGYGGIYGQR